VNDLLKSNLDALKKCNPDMFSKDFLLTWEKSNDDLAATLHVAEMLKELHRLNIATRIFNSGLGVSIFRDNSTRTRFSFASACNALGLAVSDLDEEKSQIAHGETVRETANMISFMAEVVGIRDDMYIGEGDSYQREVAAAVQEGFEKGILHQRPTLVNLQSDIDHPTQSMSDLAKMKDYFGGIENLRGKKIAMTWAYSPSYGKPLSVPQGVIGLMSRFGMDVSLAYPEGYELLPDVVDISKKQSDQSGGTFTVTHSMEEAFENADVVYPKSWASFRVMEQRRDLLHARDQKGLKDLEHDCLEENAQHMDWTCTEELMKSTRDGKALYQHCLPADITGVSCSHGEVEASVFDRYIPDTYHEASFKPPVIAAMIFLAKMKDPAAALEALIKNAEPRLI
jgi:knotted carbamoyltransferase YgeW